MLLPTTTATLPYFASLSLLSPQQCSLYLQKEEEEVVVIFWKERGGRKGGVKEQNWWKNWCETCGNIWRTMGKRGRLIWPLAHHVQEDSCGGGRGFYLLLFMGELVLIDPQTPNPKKMVGEQRFSTFSE